jgi:regulator of RNase E activity RraA
VAGTTARSTNVGFRVFTEIERPPKEVVAAFAGLETTWITDAMNRFGGMAGSIRPAVPGMRLCGPAVTVRVPPGDYLMIYQALEVAEPGDVIVIESRGFTAVAQWGDLVSLAAKGLGLGGAVMDGSLRDLEGIRRAEFPVFALPVLVPNGGMKDGPGEVNVPIACGGVPVLPGDLVVGDANGVVVVPRQDAAAVLERARAIGADEVTKVADLQAGKHIPDWLAETLREKGCEEVEGKW